MKLFSHRICLYFSILKPGHNHQLHSGQLIAA